MSTGDDDMLRTQNRQLERENRNLRRSLRDEFAMAALTGLLAAHGNQLATESASSLSFKHADAMLEARQS